MISGDSVWERHGASSLNRRSFILLMGFFTIAGLALSAFFAYQTTGWMEMIPAVKEGEEATWLWVGPLNEWVFFICVLICSLAGTCIALGSMNPLISLVGYVMVAGPFGLLLGPVVGMYEAASVVKVLYITGAVTGVLSIIGAAIPRSLESWSGFLFAGLIVVLFGTIGIPLLGWVFPGVPIEGALTMIDWLAVFVFSGYIVFDMNRAMRVPATVNNAVDCSLALYLDIINLFIRLLSIMGQKKS